MCLNTLWNKIENYFKLTNTQTYFDQNAKFWHWKWELHCENEIRNLINHDPTLHFEMHHLHHASYLNATVLGIQI